MCIEQQVVDQYNQQMQHRHPGLLQQMTSYNDNAKLDQDSIQRTRTSIYHRQIYLTERVDSWNQDVFAPKLFNAEFISHPALNDNLMFKEIKQTFVDYNKEVTGQDAKVNQNHVKSTKMAELMMLMFSLLEIDDKQSQLKVLKKAYNWMKENLKISPDKYESMRNQRAIETQKIVIGLPQIPSNHIKTEMSDFKDKTRTLHKYQYAPQDRIRYYKRRMMNFEESMKIVSNSYVPDKHNNKVKYVKTEPEVVFQVNQLADNFNSANPIEDIQEVIALEDPVHQLGTHEEEDHEPELEDQQDKNPQGKLNPTTKNYTYADASVYQKSETVLNRHMQVLMARQQTQFRQDQENEQSVKKMADRKSRFNTETNRKLQSLREMVKMANSQRKTKARSMTETPSQTPTNVRNISALIHQHTTEDVPYQQYSSQQRVKEVRRSLARNTETSDSEIPRRQQGLSMFGKLKPGHNKKWLSLILKQQKSKSELDLSLEELGDIKARLAYRRVPFEIKSIYDGLLKPADMSVEELSGIGHPTGSLLSNPDFKVAKKKKRKTRK